MYATTANSIKIKSLEKDRHQTIINGEINIKHCVSDISYTLYLFRIDPKDGTYWHVNLENLYGQLKDGVNSWKMTISSRITGFWPTTIDASLVVVAVQNTSIRGGIDNPAVLYHEALMKDDLIAPNPYKFRDTYNVVNLPTGGVRCFYHTNHTSIIPQAGPVSDGFVQSSSNWSCEC